MISSPVTFLGPGRVMAESAAAYLSFHRCCAPVSHGWPTPMEGAFLRITDGSKFWPNYSWCSPWRLSVVQTNRRMRASVPWCTGWQKQWRRCVNRPHCNSRSWVQQQQQGKMKSSTEAGSCVSQLSAGTGNVNVWILPIFFGRARL